VVATNIAEASLTIELDAIQKGLDYQHLNF
jgi:hypothetical protein